MPQTVDEGHAKRVLASYLPSIKPAGHAKSLIIQLPSVMLRGVHLVWHPPCYDSRIRPIYLKSLLFTCDNDKLKLPMLWQVIHFVCSEDENVAGRNSFRQQCTSCGRGQRPICMIQYATMIIWTIWAMSTPVWDVLMICIYFSVSNWCVMKIGTNWHKWG